MAHPLFVGWVRMGRRLVLVMLLFGFAIVSEVHGSEGSVAWEFQSKSSYLPSFLYRIVLPVSLGPSSKSTNMQVHLSRMISPSALAPHGPIERVPRESPTLPKESPLAHPRETNHSPPPHKEVPLVPPIMHQNTSMIAPSVAPGPSVSPVSVSPPVIHGKRNGRLVAAPPRDAFNHLSPASHSPNKEPHKAPKPPDNAAPQSHPFPRSPSRKAVLAPAHAPTTPISFHRHHARKNVNSRAPPPAGPVEIHWHHARKEVGSPASPPVAPVEFHRHHARKEVSSPHGPSSSHRKGPVIAPAPSHPLVTQPNWRRQRQHVDPPLQGPFSPIPSAVPPAMNRGASASLPSVAVPSNPSGREAPSQPPIVHPSAAFPRKPTMPLPTPIRSLPPPPPSHDCTEVTCAEPLTNTLPGSPCGCVWPIQVALHLNVALYTFFPLVSELAQEIATGIFMKQSQVRIMGANAASEDQDETIVLIDLVPFGVKFDNTTAFLTFEKFWHKQVTIKPSLFGDYDVLYVRYPGLPLSPPSSPSSININGGQLTNGNNGRTIHPLGVDVRKRKGGLGGGLIVVIVLSSAIALVLSIMALWLLIWKHDGGHTHQPLSTPRSLTPLVKPTGAGSMVLGSWASSTSPTFSSSIATYTGSAKTFSIGEIEKATNKFNVSRVLGEGGFGRVYSGVLEDGTKVAVKVLKRDDQQGTREFLAEVEMLSRLHHRNLVKLLGICTDEQSRCLVYELIPNGSVESHLHGVDKETAPLDWNARMKIALGSARGLAYLHEDSSPRVIHRDFKSSNILLEHDFTPKVSDFGLARTALDGGNDHISTRVMGTFGYVAPEYAMTGHLLVKSDVYSYGVVLLELLTGRKPVDMLRSPGQENLVTWARPLLTSKDGLEMIIDPSLGSNFPFDSVAKVAAIVSMCVQPEVSHRPFMGEVVQALKLVCNEDEEKRGASGSCSQEELSSAQGIDTGASNASIQLPETRSFLTADYDAGIEVERALSASEIFSTTPRITRQDSGSFRRHSSSEPLNISKNEQFWKGGDSRGSIRERGVVIKSWGGPESENMWP